jgi:nitrate reductase gamma subunit
MKISEKNTSNIWSVQFYFYIILIVLHLLTSRRILKRKDKKRTPRNQVLMLLFLNRSQPKLWDEELNVKFTNR